jgi:penicillin amidase
LTSGESVQLDGEQAPGTLDDFRARLTDTFSARAARLMPLLVKIPPEGWRQERVTGMLRKWDHHIGDNNKEAPFFAVYQLELARAAFADELGPDPFEAYVAQSDQYQAALDQIIDNPDDGWWDDVTTPEREARDDILKRAYEPTLEWIGRNYGDLHMLWEWDLVHGSRLHHPLGDTWPWDQLLTPDLHPDGWAGTSNASPGGLPCLGGICMGSDLYRAKAVYGYRQIMDAGDPSTLWFTLLPGQSGHPFHAHFNDLIDEWLAGVYLPLRLAPSPEDVAGVDSVLILAPED